MTTPHYWQHGDTVTVTRLNDMITAMDEVYAKTRDYPLRFAVNHADNGETFTIFKRGRYLHFGSNGTLEDPANVEPDVTLTEDADIERGTLDLDTIDWLATGSMFYVRSVSWVWLDNYP